MSLRIIGLLIVFFSNFFIARSQNVLIEAESFDQTGGWVVDPQFVEQMGSPYLMAHGMGIPVADASSTFQLEEKGMLEVVRSIV